MADVVEVAADVAGACNEVELIGDPQDTVVAIAEPVHPPALAPSVDAGAALATVSESVKNPRKRRMPGDGGANDLSAEAALAAAAAEGLTLVPAINTSGYKRVHLGGAGGPTCRRFQLDLHPSPNVGYFRSAEAAALTYARTLGIEGSKAKAEKAAQRMASFASFSEIIRQLEYVGAQDALAIAEAEGMTLVRSARATSGFKHVRSLENKKIAKRFRLSAVKGTRVVIEGNFMSAEAAAVAYVRHVGVDVAAAEAVAEKGPRRPFNEGPVNSIEIETRDVASLDGAAALELAQREGLASQVEALRRPGTVSVRVRGPNQPPGTSLLSLLSLLAAPCLPPIYPNPNPNPPSTLAW